MAGTVRFDFSGKSVLVTGASRGIGRSIATGFAAAGANISVLAEDKGIEDAAASIASETGANVRALRCDISDSRAVASALADIERIDVLVNNAGYQPRTPISPALETSDVEFERVIAINVMGTWNVTRNALELMPDGGRVLMTSSIWGKTGAAEYSGYCASKHANIGFMRSLALELGTRGITVNAICPGWVDTEGAMWTVRQIAAEQGRPVEKILSEYVTAQPLPGIMKADDLVGAYLFLASSAARDITGQTLNVDRGSFIG